MPDEPQPSSCDGYRTLQSRVEGLERHVFVGRRGLASEADRTSPVTCTLADLVSARQWENIRRNARAAGVDADAVCAALFRSGTADLNRAAADEFNMEQANLARQSQKSGGRG